MAATRKCKDSDYWETPPDLFEELNREFHFEWDACATTENTKVPGNHFDEDHNALTHPWAPFGQSIFCNPPYSKEGQKDAFIAKASEAQADGCTVVLVIPAKVNTKAFHRYIWDKARHQPRPGVQIRFPEGRPVFWKNGKRAAGGGRNEIMIVVFNPVGRPR